jgi:hypothetical protein
MCCRRGRLRRGYHLLLQGGGGRTIRAAPSVWGPLERWPEVSVKRKLRIRMALDFASLVGAPGVRTGAGAHRSR